MKKILYFTSTWCSPCRALGPIMDELSSQFPIEKIDVDSNKDTVMQYGVKNIPTIILIDGGEKGRLVGSQSKQTIINLYEKV